MHSSNYSDTYKKEKQPQSERFKEPYTNGLHSSTLLGTLPTLLRWKGSIYKALFPWIPIYIAAYYGVHFVMSNGITLRYTVRFRDLSKKVVVFQEDLPVLLVLGVLIHQVVKRWWDCVTFSPEHIYPIMLACFIFPDEEMAREQRRSFCRIINASLILTFRGVAESVKNKYPDYNSLIERGLLTEEEAHTLKLADVSVGSTPKPWLTVFWAQNRIAWLQRKDEVDSLLVGHLKAKTFSFQNNCSKFLSSYGASISLFAVQFCTWTVHVFGLLALLGSQFVTWKPFPPAHALTAVAIFYVPVFSWLKYTAFYIILHVTKILLYPFGQLYENTKILEMFEEQFEMADIVQKIFDNPELLDLQATLFTDEGEIRPYFCENVLEDDASIYELLEYYANLDNDEQWRC